MRTPPCYSPIGQQGGVSHGYAIGLMLRFHYCLTALDTVQRTGDWNPTGSRPWLQFFWSGIFFAPLDCSKHAKNSAIDRGRTFRVVKKNLDKKYFFILVNFFSEKYFRIFYFISISKIFLIRISRKIRFGHSFTSKINFCHYWGNI